MKIKLKTASLSLKPDTPLHLFQGHLQELFFPLEEWGEEELDSIVGIMHSLTFPKAGELSAAADVNLLLSKEYQKRGWPVIGGDTSGGDHLVLTITLLGY